MVFNKKRFSKAAFCLLTSFSVLLSSAASFSFAVASENQTSIHSDPLIEKTLRSLSLKQKVGQLFIFGFMGTDLSHGLSDTIQLQHPGGIIVFGRNIKTARQLANLNYAAQSLSLRTTHVPMFIAVDQEGGSVIRVKTQSPLPSALALGGTKRNDLAFDAGAGTGKLLQTLGFTMNLAPVVDVSDPNQDNFIGTRTFGKDPQLVASMGSSFADGLKKYGIVPTAKHFPGHGGVAEDSHELTPKKEVSLQELMQLDLLPFAQIARDKTPWAVMLAHIAFPKIDPSGVPATFSKIIVTELLRKKLGYSGVVMTDDIEMGGASQIKNVGERAVRAVEAGADLVMLAWNRQSQTLAYNSLLRAVQSGRISETRIDESVRRLLIAKRGWLKRPPLHAPTNTVLLSALKSPELKKVSEVTVEQRLTDAANDLDHGFALEAADRPILVFSASTGFYKTFKAALPKANVSFVRLTTTTPDLSQLLRAKPDAFGLFYISGPHSAELANQIRPDVADRVLVINTETSGLLENPQSFKQIVDVYFKHPALGRLTAQHFFVPKPEVESAPENDSPAEAAVRLPSAERK